MDILRKEEEVDEAAELAARLGLDDEGEVETSDEVTEAIEYGIRNNSNINPDWIKLAFYITKTANGVDAWVDDLSRMDKEAEELVELDSDFTNLFRDSEPMSGREKIPRKVVITRIQDDFNSWEEQFLQELEKDELPSISVGYKQRGKRYGEFGTKIRTHHTPIYEILNTFYGKLARGDTLESNIQKPKAKGDDEETLEERKKKTGDLVKTVKKMLELHAGGDEHKAANKLEKLDESLLANIQRLFLNGRANLHRDIRVLLVPSGSEWDKQERVWSEYEEYNGQISVDVFNSMMRLNKKKMLVSRKEEHELLSELEEFEGAEDLELAIDNWWDTYNETGELPDDRHGKMIRQAFFKLVNKIRLDTMEESGVSPSDVEKAEFLYFLLKQLGKASTIQFGVFNKLNESLKDSELDFDKNKEFTVESPTGDEEE